MMRRNKIPGSPGTFGQVGASVTVLISCKGCCRGPGIFRPPRLFFARTSAYTTARTPAGAR